MGRQSANSSQKPEQLLQLAVQIHAACNASRGQKLAGQLPNSSFKPSPLRGLGAGSYDSAIAVAATLPGLTQALGRETQE